MDTNVGVFFLSLGYMLKKTSLSPSYKFYGAKKTTSSCIKVSSHTHSVEHIDNNCILKANYCFGYFQSLFLLLV